MKHNVALFITCLNVFFSSSAIAAAKGKDNKTNNRLQMSQGNQEDKGTKRLRVGRTLSSTCPNGFSGNDCNTANDYITITVGNDGWEELEDFCAVQNCCTEEDSCSDWTEGITVTVWKNACDGTRACYTHKVKSGTTFGENSCNGEYACYRIGGVVTVEANSCHEESVCSGLGVYANGSVMIGTDACIGLHACKAMGAKATSIIVKSGACTADYSCAGMGELLDPYTVEVGSDSCNKHSACFRFAQYDAKSITIGDNACSQDFNQCKYCMINSNNDVVIEDNYSEECEAAALPTASQVPSASPSYVPTSSPTIAPTNSPTAVPTSSPTKTPTIAPTPQPTVEDTLLYRFQGNNLSCPSGTEATTLNEDDTCNVEDVDYQLYLGYGTFIPDSKLCFDGQVAESDGVSACHLCPPGTNQNFFILADTRGTTTETSCVDPGIWIFSLLMSDSIYNTFTDLDELCNDSNMITVLTDSMDTIMEDALCETSIPDFGGEEGGEPDFGGEGDEFDIPIP